MKQPTCFSLGPGHVRGGDCGARKEGFVAKSSKVGGCGGGVRAPSPRTKPLPEVDWDVRVLLQCQPASEANGAPIGPLSNHLVQSRLLSETAERIPWPAELYCSTNFIQGVKTSTQRDFYVRQAGVPRRLRAAGVGARGQCAVRGDWNTPASVLLLRTSFCGKGPGLGAGLLFNGDSDYSDERIRVLSPVLLEHAQGIVGTVRGRASEYSGSKLCNKQEALRVRCLQYTKQMAQRKAALEAFDGLRVREVLARGNDTASTLLARFQSTAAELGSDERIELAVGPRAQDAEGRACRRAGWQDVDFEHHYAFDFASSLLEHPGSKLKNLMLENAKGDSARFFAALGQSQVSAPNFPELAQDLCEYLARDLLSITKLGLHDCQFIGGVDWSSLAGSNVRELDFSCVKGVDGKQLGSALAVCLRAKGLDKLRVAYCDFSNETLAVVGVEVGRIKILELGDYLNDASIKLIALALKSPNSELRELKLCEEKALPVEAIAGGDVPPRRWDAKRPEAQRPWQLAQQLPQSDPALDAFDRLRFKRIAAEYHDASAVLAEFQSTAASLEPDERIKLEVAYPLKGVELLKDVLADPQASKICALKWWNYYGKDDVNSIIPLLINNCPELASLEVCLKHHSVLDFVSRMLEHPSNKIKVLEMPPNTGDSARFFAALGQNQVSALTLRYSPEFAQGLHEYLARDLLVRLDVRMDNKQVPSEMVVSLANCTRLAELKLVECTFSQPTAFTHLPKSITKLVLRNCTFVRGFDWSVLD
ncbi:hypothetical protein BASA62_005084 [Batrachochytrium salamandrivorans]|nr:hypothetical protein BASA62_005084 [Batrachochytrium salamandrivorans]